jgi:hypothetical protein
MLIRSYFGRTSIPPLVQIIDSCLGFGFPFIPCINVTNEVVTYIVADLEMKEASASNGELYLGGYVREVREDYRTWTIH